MLPLQRWSSKLETTGAMARGAGWNAALRIAGKHQAPCGIGLPQAAAGLGNAVPAQRRQSARLGREVSGDVGRGLRGQRLRHGPHDAPETFAGAIIVELFVD